MKRCFMLFLMFVIVCASGSVPKPMESLTNYNVLLLHGAYGHYKDKDKKVLQGFAENEKLVSAYDAEYYLGNANIGRYTEKPDDKKRLNRWLSKEIFEEPEWLEEKLGTHNSYIYHWRSFSDPPNSSITNAIELGDRTWNKDGKFGKRRALVEEAQEVKAAYDTLYGQPALEIIRKNPDLYRQLASRYTLVGSKGVYPDNKK